MGAPACHVPRARAILFSSPMVRALLSGHKTVTRRLVRPAPMTDRYYEGDIDVAILRDNPDGQGAGARFAAEIVGGGGFREEVRSCPYGAVGDHLIVKESAWLWCETVVSSTKTTRAGRPKRQYVPDGQHVRYSVDAPQRPTDRIDDDPAHGWHLKIGRFLPAWASRFRLEITEIRCERVQAITGEEVLAEGVGEPWNSRGIALAGGMTKELDGQLREKFRGLWLDINGEDSWKSNPFVWVIRFRPLPCLGLS